MSRVVIVVHPSQRVQLARVLQPLLMINAMPAIAAIIDGTWMFFIGLMVLLLLQCLLNDFLKVSIAIGRYQRFRVKIIFIRVLSIWVILFERGDIRLIRLLAWQQSGKSLARVLVESW